jgi:hypothetical protein
MKNFEVSFNSPQCGWMSIGFKNGENEFNSTTAYTPHSHALSDILQGLTSLLTPQMPKDSFAIAWSRNPEAFDLFFNREGENIDFKVIEYPTFNRLESEGETVFTHQGNIRDFCRAFHQTFAQLYEARETDEFEMNWKQPFPFEDFDNFSKLVNAL